MNEAIIHRGYGIGPARLFGDRWQAKASSIQNTPRLSLDFSFGIGATPEKAIERAKDRVDDWLDHRGRPPES
jgi:hypothetical protein